MVETKCAVCLLSDGLVINIIVAVPSDLPPDGCQLIEVMNGMLCDMGWTWDGTQFNPPPVVVEA